MDDKPSATLQEATLKQLVAARIEIARLREQQTRLMDGWDNWDKQLRSANAEVERLRALLAEPHSCDIDAEQRVINLAAAIREEHFRMDGANVTMSMPQHEHERSIMRCHHPLCMALGRSKPAQEAEQK